jgi:hypothetical protein
VEECCHRLEERWKERLDLESHALLADTLKAALEARQLVAQLQSLTVDELNRENQPQPADGRAKEGQC